MLPASSKLAASRRTRFFVSGTLTIATTFGAQRASLVDDQRVDFSSRSSASAL
jgi:hypothetical protein